HIRFLYLVPGETEAVVTTFEKRRMATDRLFALVPERGGDEVEVDPLPFTVGRDEENHLALEDESLSSRHARFFWEDNHLVLEDLESTNGTFVKRRRIDQARVGHGAEIEFGSVFFLLRDVDYAFPRLHRRTASHHKAIGIAVVLGVLVFTVVLPLVLGLGGGESGDPAEGNRLKRNPSFESPPKKGGALLGWTLKGETFSLDHEEARHGETSLQVKLPGSGMGWASAEAVYDKRIDVAGGKTYVASCRLRAKDTSGVAGIRLDWFRTKESRPFACTYSDLVTGDTDWLEVQTPMTAPEGADSAALVLVAKGDGGVDWFDDVRFTAGPPGSSSTLTRIGAGRVKVRLDHRGLGSVFLDRVGFLRGVGVVFWDLKRVPKASQELCLPAAGFPRAGGGEFLLRAEAVKLAEGLPIPFEFRALPEDQTVKLVYRFHADAGRLVNGDRIAVALKAFDPVQTVVLYTPAGEERLARGSFGSVAGVREILLRGPQGDLALRCDPPLTVNALAGERDVMLLYTSVGVTRADLGNILEITLRVGLPPDRQEERAAQLLERAEEQLKARRLGRAYALFATVVKEYGGVGAAKEEAESRMRSLRQEFERQRSTLEKAFADFRAAPSASTLSAFLFRLDEMEDRFAGMEDVKRCSALREEAFDTYGHVAGAGFEKARKALAEAKAAYETGDWVRAEKLCARLLTETQEEALMPG
ncbi:MAG: FHA domain-containing protein, partial [Planctomycetota bacterium]